MTHNEMIEKLEQMENVSYYQKSASFALIKRLLQGASESDPDMEALTAPLLERVIDLLLECYDEKDLIKWLEKQDFDPIRDFRFAEMMEFSEYDSIEELEQAKEDALFVDEENEIIVLSW